MKIYDICRKYFLTAVFLIFIFYMSADYFANIYSKNSSTTPTEKVEYTEEFEKTYLSTSSGTSKKSKSKTDAYKEEWKEFTKDMTANSADFRSNDFFLEINTRFCNLAQMSYIPGTSVYKLDDGMLLASNDEKFSKKRMDTHVNYLSNFTQTLKEKGINYAYIDCPHKEEILSHKKALGFRFTSEIEEKAYMFELFENNNIPSLKLGDKIIKSEKDSDELYYKTDHHWKTEYGIDAAFYISEYLNSEFDYAINTDVFDRNNYTAITYEDCLLGSKGINSTIHFTEAEDFQVWIPKSNYKYNFEIPSKNISLSGDFDVLINTENLNNKKEWPVNAYGSYIYSNSAYVKIENQSIEDEHKVLIIKDSFANVIAPYLSQVIGRVDVIDIRKAQEDHFQENVMALIEENDYDTVLFIYNEFSYEFDRLYLK